MSWIDHIAEDRRLGMLRLMVEAGGTANESVLYAGVMALGHIKVTRDLVRADLDFLAERHLIAREWFGDKVMVARLTQRGLDVAEGKAEVEGVKKPSIV